MSDFDATAAKVRAVPGVVSATPLVEGQVMATKPERRAGPRAGARASVPTIIRARELIADHIVAGSLADFGDDNIAMGDRLATRLGVRVGGQDHLESRPEGTDTAFGTMPRLKTYTVAALFRRRLLRIRQHVHLRAARRGAGLLQDAKRGQLPRSLL